MKMQNNSISFGNLYVNKSVRRYANSAIKELIAENAYNVAKTTEGLNVTLSMEKVGRCLNNMDRKLFVIISRPTNFFKGVISKEKFKTRINLDDFNNSIINEIAEFRCHEALLMSNKVSKSMY